ncbi:MAG: AraC family transcriptional regulator [Clostridiaceae bacterium]
MQKRPPLIKNPGSGVNLIYDPSDLDPEFPVSGGNKETTPDSDPLTFLHYHDQLEIGYCCKGSGIFIVDDKMLPFSEGDASVIFHNELHIAKSNPGEPSYWYFIVINPVKLLNNIEPDNFSQLFKCIDGNRHFCNIINSKNSPDIIIIIREIIKEVREESILNKYAIKGLVLCLMVKLTRMFDESGLTVCSAKHNDIIRISPALDYIYRNYTQKIDVKKLADMCKMSITNFRRMFGKTMGMSPYEYVINFRIHMASILLKNTGMSILDISMQTGYDTLSCFNRYFKKITGMRPKELRRQSSG